MTDNSKLVSKLDVPHKIYIHDKTDIVKQLASIGKCRYLTSHVNPDGGHKAQGLYGKNLDFQARSAMDSL